MSQEILQQEEKTSSSEGTTHGSDFPSNDGRGREAAARSRADSNSSLPPVARSSSSASSIIRCDSRSSYASSLGGNRDSIISNSDAPSCAAPPLPELQEEDVEHTNSTEENDSVLSKTGDRFAVTTRPITQGDVTTSLQTQLPDAENESRVCLVDDNSLARQTQINVKDQKAQGKASFSQQVPRFNSTLDNEDEIQFLLDKARSHREKMFLRDYSLLKTQVKTIYSPAFEVLHHLYCACLLVHLGEERLSVGIRIMKGKEDKSLTWPFNMIVMFRLKNVSGGQDVIKMFRSDRNASRLKEAVGRPKTDMNAPMGYLSFISKQRLESEGFVKDNQICFMCYLFPKDAIVDHMSEYPCVLKQFHT